MSTVDVSTSSGRSKSGVKVRFLDPETTRLFVGDHGLLHVGLGEPGSECEEVYRGVFAVLAFPITSPNHFVSLRRFGPDGRDVEIGMIENPEQFSRQVRELIARSLARNYFEQTIRSIRKVEFKHGLLFFEVETEAGQKEFQMKWRSDRTQDYGEGGKVLLDVYENRFILPDVHSLPKVERETLTRYIYW